MTFVLIVALSVNIIDIYGENKRDIYFQNQTVAQCNDLLNSISDTNTCTKIILFSSHWDEIYKPTLPYVLK